MKKISRKIIAMVLCLSICVSVCIYGFTAFAADSTEKEPEQAGYSSLIEVMDDLDNKMNSFSLSKKNTIKEFVKYVGNFRYLASTMKALAKPLCNIADIAQYNNAEDTTVKVFYNLINVLCNQLLDVICALFPMPDFVDADEYVSENFFAGHDTLLSSAAQNAKWSVGYANASIIPSDFKPDEYYMGGSLNIKVQKAQEILDDMKIRVTCLDDGSGRGAVVLAVIDCLGISSTDVRRIRAQLAEFAAENNIASINISATHSHSCIDLQGFGSPFIQTVVWNAFSEEYGVGKPTSGRNEKFMNNLYAVSAQAIKKAYQSMTEGTLYYTQGDISDYVRDKYDPYVFVKEAACLRFVPDNGSAQTYMVNMTCHPTTLPHTTTKTVSSDFIYYMEEEMNKHGYNFLYIQGAVGGVTKTTDHIDLPEGSDRVDTMTVYGQTLADYFMNLDKTKEIALEPVLNARHMEYFLECENNLLMLAVKSQLLNNMIVRTGDGYGADNFRLVTEMGYVTFGNKVMFGLMPCEMYPEVSIGGAQTADKAWSNTEWDSDCLKDCVDSGLDYYTVCFANDTYGYVMTDNDYAFLKPDSPADSLLSAGQHTASATVAAFKQLLALDK